MESNSPIFIRLGCYVGMLFLMAIWEQYSGARKPKSKKILHWLNNISLAWVGSLLISLALPISAIGFASIIENRHTGAFGSITFWPNLLLSLIVLDCIIYWQHRIFHRIPLLWRIHATHHLDPELDASTGGRFHPIEILLSMLIKFSAIYILGCSATAVLIFEIVLSASATFNHSNILLPNWLTRVLQPWLVTPAMHSIHHSIKPKHTHSNFGFCLNVWDKVFKSFQTLDEKQQVNLIIGLPNIKSALKRQNLIALLIFPFKYKP